MQSNFSFTDYSTIQRAGPKLNLSNRFQLRPLDQILLLLAFRDEMCGWAAEGQILFTPCKERHE